MIMADFSASLLKCNQSPADILPELVAGSFYFLPHFHAMCKRPDTCAFSYYSVIFGLPLLLLLFSIPLFLYKTVFRSWF